ncbi:PQQ-binding-like beta-propeller repeat protein [Dactylosporangium sp. NPDC000555]|uniref:outer membrane protein assembly factor BamB family protein n=1 Tax=Dactylosporangium sp. NPDC000555 TaxID=3154260 RepID=UPI003319FA7D
MGHQRGAPPIVVIDLDASAGREPLGGVARRRPGERWWPFGLLLVGVLALVTGARPITPLTPSVVLRGDGVIAFRSDGRSVYLLRQPDLARAFVESYRVRDGARRWAVPVAAGAHLAAVDGARVVLAVEEPENRSASTVVGLDAVTGAQVWRQTGYVPSFYGSAGALGVVVADAYPPGADPGQEQQRPTPYLAGIDIRTGDVRWSLETPPGSTREFVYIEQVESGDARARVEIAELDPDGTLRVRSAETAEIVRTVQLDRPGQVHGFQISGDRLLAYRSGRGTMLSSAVFDLATGRRLWQRTDEPDGVLLWWCGRALCSGIGGTTVVLDAGTGRELWRLDGRWTGLGRLDNQYLLATRSTQDVTAPSQGGVVLDAATGRIVRRIDGWDVFGGLAWPGVLVASHNAAGGTLIARLDVVTGGVTVLGRTGHWSTPPQCITTATLLTCRLDHVSIWPLPA